MLTPFCLVNVSFVATAKILALVKDLLIRLKQVYYWEIFYKRLKPLFVERLVIPECKHNMMSLRGQASWAKMTSLRGKLTALACHPTKFVNKSDKRTYLSTNIDSNAILTEELHNKRLFIEFTLKMMAWIWIWLIYKSNEITLSRCRLNCFMIAGTLIQPACLVWIDSSFTWPACACEVPLLK